MSEYALVKSGIVKAVIVADADFISANGSEAAGMYGYADGSWVLTPSKVGKGWTYADEIFAAPTRGSSISASSPATSVSADVTLSININGDGAQNIVLAANSSGVDIAADISTKVHALTPSNPANAGAFSGFYCVYADSLYKLYSGAVGASSSVVISGGTAASDLKLGVANGGTEASGTGEQ